LPFVFRSIALWGTLKKKPLVTVANAHVGQTDTVNAAQDMCSESASDDIEPDDVSSQLSEDGLLPTAVNSAADFLTMQRENWITSVAALHNTDFAVSGKYALL